jgi:hypothetical protein
VRILIAILLCLNLLNSAQNTQNKDIVYTSKEVDKYPVILTRPEPSWTRQARVNGCRHPERIYGVVKLKVVLAASGRSLKC